MSNPFTASTVYPPVTFEADPKVYHSLGSEIRRGKPGFIMSRGQLVKFAENPWKWIRYADKPTTDAMNWGSLVDRLTLTPHLVSSCYEVCPDTYPATAKKKDAPQEMKPWNWNATFCDDWRQEVLKGGKEPLKRSTLDAARVASARLLEDERVAAVLKCSKRQVQVVVNYRDKETGIDVPFKAMPDLLPEPGSEFERFIPDLKTSNDAGPDGWERKVFAEGYHIQAGSYIDAVNAATGRAYDSFLHIIQESDEPYAVGRRMLSEEFLNIGRDFYKRALRHYCQCLALNKWPGYDDQNDNAASPILDGWRLTQPEAWMIAA
jgi:hypothetical protein